MEDFEDEIGEGEEGRWRWEMDVGCEWKKSGNGGGIGGGGGAWIGGCGMGELLCASSRIDGIIRRRGRRGAFGA